MVADSGVQDKNVLLGISVLEILIWSTFYKLSCIPSFMECNWVIDVS
jgi:hypothetical protein